MTIEQSDRLEFVCVCALPAFKKRWMAIRGEDKEENERCVVRRWGREVLVNTKKRRSETKEKLIWLKTSKLKKNRHHFELRWARDTRAKDEQDKENDFW